MSQVTATAYNKKYRLKQRSTEPMKYIVDSKKKQVIFSTLTVEPEIHYLIGDTSVWGKQLILSRLIQQIYKQYRWCNAQALQRLRDQISAVSQSCIVAIKNIDGVLRFCFIGLTHAVSEFLMCLDYTIKKSMYSAVTTW